MWFLFVGVVFSSVHAANEDSEKDYVFFIGEDGQLECDTRQTIVAWNFYPTKDQQTEVEISAESQLIYDSGKYDITPDGRNLTVTQVTVDDVGMFTCVSRDIRQRFNVTVQQRSNDVSLLFMTNFHCIAASVCLCAIVRM